MDDKEKITREEWENRERQNRIALMSDLFCEHLKRIRKEKELSQKEVAQKLGVAVSTYANWEQGRTEPSIYDIFNLLWVLKIEPNELFDFNAYIEIAKEKQD